MDLDPGGDPVAGAPKIDLSIYLAKEGAGNPGENIKNAGSLNTAALNLGDNCQATLYIRRQHASPPKWAEFFQDFVKPSDFGQNSSTGAVLSIPWKQRTFLVAFGQGWHNIDSARIETEFGLRTALNILDPTSIRSIDKSTLEAQPTQMREQSGRATDVQYFGIDVERDLLRAVTGRPVDKYFGNRVSGLDSIHLSVELNPEDLPGLLDQLLVAYRSDTYKTGPFSWIDHIGLIRDAQVADELDNLLIDRINRRDIDKIWLSVPEIIDWSRVVGFRYSMGKHAPRVYDIRVVDFLAFKEGQVSRADLMRSKIYCVDADDNPVLNRPAYYYLYAELERNNEVCLLNNGKWYRVETNFVDKINQHFDSIKPYDKELPIYDDESEGAYNERVATADPESHVLMDKNLAFVPGAASGIEICDLYKNEKDFIHVKRYGGSSVLSHLFNQGLVSGELFKMDPTYRNVVNDKLPPDRKIPDPSASPLPGEYRVIYAIISESADPLSVPFFSKISLKNCIVRLEAMGFTAMLAKISVEEQRKMRKTYAPGPDKI